ncbi:hypothetical protein E2562_012618 [Oryza meyeriana var. granulata]|uniref:Uncharacterized protein n=1 Tax=Oryza meyeriana var. granulata TaxID=110450 RepID=A0A6G1CFS7_9ORYZ|nr:hypothetical protein E2562_012618 [Oryza meyeriana var. granulata]
MKQQGEDSGWSGGGRRCEAAHGWPEQARERREGDDGLTTRLEEPCSDAIFSQARGVCRLGPSVYTTTVAVIRDFLKTTAGAGRRQRPTSGPPPLWARPPFSSELARSGRRKAATRSEGSVGLDCSNG